MVVPATFDLYIRLAGATMAGIIIGGVVVYGGMHWLIRVMRDQRREAIIAPPPPTGDVPTTCAFCELVIQAPLQLCDACYGRVTDVLERVMRRELTDFPAIGADEWWAGGPQRHDEMMVQGFERTEEAL